MKFFSCSSKHPPLLSPYHCFDSIVPMFSNGVGLSCLAWGLQSVCLLVGIHKASCLPSRTAHLVLCRGFREQSFSLSNHHIKRFKILFVWKPVYKKKQVSKQPLELQNRWPKSAHLIGNFRKYMKVYNIPDSFFGRVFLEKGLTTRNWIFTDAFYQLRW